LTPEQIKEPSWTGKSITAKFPLLELDDGSVIVESAAIIQHFARAHENMSGKGAFE